MHRPPESSTTPSSLELKLLPDRIGPAKAGIGLEENLPAYQKLLQTVG
jgi:hypothetical protein